jgi:hypothetical protein
MVSEEKKAILMADMKDARAECADVLAQLPIDARRIIGKWALEWFGSASHKGIGKAIVDDAKMLFPDGIK